MTEQAEKIITELKTIRTKLPELRDFGSKLTVTTKLSVAY